jgi:hypothetical protein
MKADQARPAASSGRFKARGDGCWVEASEGARSEMEEGKRRGGTVVAADSTGGDSYWRTPNSKGGNNCPERGGRHCSLALFTNACQ